MDRWERMAEMLFDSGTKRCGRHGTVVAGAYEPDGDAPTLRVERNELNVPSIRAHRGTDVVEDSLDLVERILNGGGAQIVWILARVGSASVPSGRLEVDVPEGLSKVGFHRPAVNESRAEKGVRFPPLRTDGPGGVQ